MKILFLIGLQLIIVIGPPRHERISSAQWFVSPLGNDSNSCTSLETACRTIAGAQNRPISAGDIIEVSPGRYPSVTLTKSGSVNRKITYRGHSGACPSTVNDNIHAPRTRPNPGAITGEWTVRASYIVIDCFKINPVGANGISILGSGTGGVSGLTRSHNTIINNYVDGNGEDCNVGISPNSTTSPEFMPTDLYIGGNYITRCSFGILLRVTNTVVENNEIYRLRGFVGSGDMDYMRVFGEDIVVRGNFLHGNDKDDCNGVDCHIDCFQNFNIDGDDEAVARRITIDRNTCFNADQGIIMQDVSLGNPGPPSGSHDTIMVTNNVFGFGAENSAGMGANMVFNSVTNVTAYHNTFLEGISRYRAQTTFTHRNNVHYVATATPIDVLTGATGTYTSNLLKSDDHTYGYGTYPGNVLNENPMFVGASAYDDFDEADDFSLQPGSPAVGAGATLGILLDRLGLSRPWSRPDLGAYERRNN